MEIRDEKILKLCDLHVELAGEPDEAPPHHGSSLHPLHQTQLRLQTAHL